MDWIHVDWRKTNRALSEELGCTMVSVNNARKKYYPDDPYSHDTERFWDNMDWSKSNTQIVQETGFCISAVRMNRFRFDPNENGYQSRKKKSEKVYSAYVASHKPRFCASNISWLYR